MATGSKRRPVIPQWSATKTRCLQWCAYRHSIKQAGEVQARRALRLAAAHKNGANGVLRSAGDPGCVKTCTGKECAELFSLLASPDSSRQRYWFSNRRNQDGISTRKFCVGVFTQPGSKGEILAASKCRP